MPSRLETTLQIAPDTQALRCLRPWTLRCRSETWHRLLESGCQGEAHQHHTAERLAGAITMDAIIA